MTADVVRNDGRAPSVGAGRPGGATTTTSIDAAVLDRQRRTRLCHVMADAGVPALLTADPFGVRYATGTRNMLVHGLTGPDRLAFVTADGYCVLWEFAGCEHLWADHPGVDELRPAPALNAKKTPSFRDEAARFAVEIDELCRRVTGQGRQRLAVEALDAPVTDALRDRGITVLDGTGPMQTAMMIKQPEEVTAMRAAVAITERAEIDLVSAIEPGRTEQEVWAEFHRSLIAEGGELVVTRLLQAGPRTFPYFQEASPHAMEAGDLVCFDTDAVALHGYSVDYSRTYLCGDGEPTRRQRELFSLAREQLDHNSSLLRPGRSFEDFARHAFDVPEPFRRYGYYQLAHGLGLAGGHPNIPRFDGGRYPLAGGFEPGMVICVESYIGDPGSGQGVKLENQYLIRDHDVDLMTTSPITLDAEARTVTLGV